MTAARMTLATPAPDRLPPLEQLAVGVDLRITVLDWDDAAEALEPLDPEPWASEVKHLLKVVQTQWMLRLRSGNEQFARKPKDYDPWPSRERSSGPFALMLWPSPDSTDDAPQAHLVVPIWRLDKHREVIRQGIETAANLRKVYTREITELAANMRLSSAEPLTRLAHRISAAIDYHKLQPPGPEASPRLRQDWQDMETELRQAYRNIRKARERSDLPEAGIRSR